MSTESYEDEFFNGTLRLALQCCQLKLETEAVVDFFDILGIILDPSHIFFIIKNVSVWPSAG